MTSAKYGKQEKEEEPRDELGWTKFGRGQRNFYN